MKKITCKICGKIIEGFTKNQIDYLMRQHNLAKHFKKKKNGKK